MSDLESLLRDSKFSYISIDKAAGVTRVTAWNKLSRHTSRAMHDDPMEALRLALSREAEPSRTSLADLLG